MKRAIADPAEKLAIRARTPDRGVQCLLPGIADGGANGGMHEMGIGQHDAEGAEPLGIGLGKGVERGQSGEPACAVASTTPARGMVASPGIMKPASWAGVARCSGVIAWPRRQRGALPPGCASPRDI